MKFDFIVVTAANAAQARGYRAQLKGRDNVLVVADPGGRRVGSLGATVNLLHRLKLSGRVLVCHSGGAATIAAVLGRVDPHEIAELTLRLEQEMRTGGGWQDQFGGLFGGVKILKSAPGKKQKISVREVPADKLARVLAERGLLYFTGQKRMARNILRNVLAFYADNPHDFAKILVKSLKKDAAACAAAIEIVRPRVRRRRERLLARQAAPRSGQYERARRRHHRAHPSVDGCRDADRRGWRRLHVHSHEVARGGAKDPHGTRKFSRFYGFAIDPRGMTLERM